MDSEKKQFLCCSFFLESSGKNGLNISRSKLNLTKEKTDKSN